MLLKLHDSGDAVKVFQRGLNNLGSILLVDGDFGPSTRDAVIDARVLLERPGPPEADDALQATVAAVPDPFPPLTAAGITFIARFEVESPAAYRKLYAVPIWPGGDSGVTIGIGYDLRFNGETEMKADWGDRLPADALARLTAVTKRQGSADLVAKVRDITIPLLAAIAVFIRRSMPRYLNDARSIFPEIDALTPPQRTALASLVYNRGAGLTDHDPVKQERREMREIQEALAAGRLDDVPAQFESMTRLWPTQGGLVRRRRDEAKLWRAGFAALQLD